ncbi:hypothetical protein ACWDR1_00895 [Streptosporangium sandarakinum]
MPVTDPHDDRTDGTEGKDDGESRNAKEALDQAALLTHRMRTQGRWHLTFIALLGLVMFVLITATGILVDQSLQMAGFLLALMTLFGLPAYTASRKVIPRHHRWVYAATPIGGALLALTVSLGRTLFPDVAWWWVGGAIFSTLPFWVTITVNLVALRER